MPKRFTDTDKWKKPFIRGLQGAYKLLWFYIVDDCDHAGIWQVDIEVAQLRIGEKITLPLALKNFGKKIIQLDSGTKWFIPSFIEFQYPSGLNPDNKAHGGAIKLLQKYELIDNEFKPLTSPLQGSKDMVMDKEQAMDTVKEREPSEKKVQFRDNIKMTILERDKLLSELGADLLEKCYEYLSAYKIEKNYKTQSDYLTIKRWVIDAVKKQSNGNKQTPTGRDHGLSILASNAKAKFERIHGRGNEGTGG